MGVRCAAPPTSWSHRRASTTTGTRGSPSTAFEHASVAAFARLAIDRMIHGAPAELVDAAHVAARDEIRHAQQCYGIASAFAGCASSWARSVDDAPLHVVERYP